MSHRACKISYLWIASTLILGGCKAGDAPSGDAPGKQPSSGAPAATPGWGASSIAPDPGGKVITVELYTDGDGNYFKPAEVHAKRGDVIRYTLKVGVHNIHFLADSNSGRSAYPQAPSDFLQLPGQTWDLAVKMPSGSYYFQCDPHSALGMKGHVIVE